MSEKIMNTYMTVKGQVVIPSRIRQQLGVTEGTRLRVEVSEAGQKIVLTPITPAYVHSVRGRYKGKGLLRALAAEKAADRER